MNNAACCKSCRIVAKAVATLAYAIGYEETGNRITALLIEMGSEIHNPRVRDEREGSLSDIEQHAALTGVCPWNEYGQHNWLPWLRLDNGSFVTRCLTCGRVEQWDQ